MNVKALLLIFAFAVFAQFSGSWISPDSAPSFSGLAMAQTQEDLLLQGKYIITAIQGCGCHTSRNRDGSNNMKLYLAGAPSKPPPKGPPGKCGMEKPQMEKTLCHQYHAES